MYVTNIYADNFTLYRCASSFSSVLSSSSVRPNSLWGTTNRRRQHSTTLSSVQKEMKKGQWQPFKAIINILRLFFFFSFSLSWLIHSLPIWRSEFVNALCNISNSSSTGRLMVLLLAAARTSARRQCDQPMMMVCSFYVSILTQNIWNKKSEKRVGTNERIIRQENIV